MHLSIFEEMGYVCVCTSPEQRIVWRERECVCVCMTSKHTLDLGRIRASLGFANAYMYAFFDAVIFTREDRPCFS